MLSPSLLFVKKSKTKVPVYGAEHDSTNDDDFGINLAFPQPDDKEPLPLHWLAFNIGTSWLLHLQDNLDTAIKDLFSLSPMSKLSTIDLVHILTWDDDSLWSVYRV